MSSRRRTITSKGPELGEITFEDWYEVPVFDSDRDERLEQLATSKRRPMRVVGAAMVRLAGDRDRDRVSGRDGAAARPSVRERWERALDRWAVAETDAQARLEAVMLPKRWRV